jgi:hypothetical protein
MRSLRSSDWAEIRMMDAKGQELKTLPDRKNAGYFEVTLPAALFKGKREKQKPHVELDRLHSVING